MPGEPTEGERNSRLLVSSSRQAHDSRQRRQILKWNTREIEA